MPTNLFNSNIVRIHGADGTSVEGTGIRIGSDLIVTCSHIVKHRTNILVSFYKHNKWCKAESDNVCSVQVETEWPTTLVSDLSLLKFKHDPLFDIDTNYFSTPVEGLEVDVYGFPNEMGNTEKCKVSKPIFNGWWIIKSEQAAAIHGGFSGGPVLDRKSGHIVGIISLGDNAHTSYLIPANAVIGFLRPLNLQCELPDLPLRSLGNSEEQDSCLRHAKDTFEKMITDRSVEPVANAKFDISRLIEKQSTNKNETLKQCKINSLGALVDAIHNGARILILGDAGSGKTIQMLQLAVVLANRRLEFGFGKFPIYLNATDMTDDFILDTYIKRQYPFLKLNDNNVVLILDAMDQYAQTKRSFESYFENWKHDDALVATCKRDECANYQAFIENNINIVARIASLEDVHIEEICKNVATPDLFALLKRRPILRKFANGVLNLFVLVRLSKEISIEKMQNDVGGERIWIEYINVRMKIFQQSKDKIMDRLGDLVIKSIPFGELYPLDDHDILDRFRKTQIPEKLKLHSHNKEFVDEFMLRRCPGIVFSREDGTYEFVHSIVRNFFVARVVFKSIERTALSRFGDCIVSGAFCWIRTFLSVCVLGGCLSIPLLFATITLLPVTASMLIITTLRTLFRMRYYFKSQGIVPLRYKIAVQRACFRSIKNELICRLSDPKTSSSEIQWISAVLINSGDVGSMRFVLEQAVGFSRKSNNIAFGCLAAYTDGDYYPDMQPKKFWNHDRIVYPSLPDYRLLKNVLKSVSPEFDLFYVWNKQRILWSMDNVREVYEMSTSTVPGISKLGRKLLSDDARVEIYETGELICFLIERGIFGKYYSDILNRSFTKQERRKGSWFDEHTEETAPLTEEVKRKVEEQLYAHVYADNAEMRIGAIEALWLLNGEKARLNTLLATLLVEDNEDILACALSKVDQSSVEKVLTFTKHPSALIREIALSRLSKFIGIDDTVFQNAINDTHGSIKLLAAKRMISKGLMTPETVLVVDTSLKDQKLRSKALEICKNYYCQDWIEGIVSGMDPIPSEAELLALEKQSYVHTFDLAASLISSNEYYRLPWVLNFLLSLDKGRSISVIFQCAINTQDGHSFKTCLRTLIEENADCNWNDLYSSEARLRKKSQIVESFVRWFLPDSISCGMEYLRAAMNAHPEFEARATAAVILAYRNDSEGMSFLNSCLRSWLPGRAQTTAECIVEGRLHVGEKNLLSMFRWIYEHRLNRRTMEVLQRLVDTCPNDSFDIILRATKHKDASVSKYAKSIMEVLAQRSS